MRGGGRGGRATVESEANGEEEEDEDDGRVDTDKE